MNKRNRSIRGERGVAAIELAGVLVICLTLSVGLRYVGDTTYGSFHYVAYKMTGGTKGGQANKGK